MRSLAIASTVARSRPSSGGRKSKIAASRTDAYQRTFLRYWASHGFPDVVALTHRIPYTSRTEARVLTYRANTPLVLLLASSYRPISTHYNYSLYLRNDSTCAVRPAERPVTP